MKAGPVDCRLLSALSAMIGYYEYGDYRSYPRFDPEQRARILIHEIQAADLAGTVTGIWDGSELRAVGFVEPLQWDSAYFGFPMGRLGPLVVERGPASRDVLTQLLDALMDSASIIGLRHLTVKVDCEHTDAILKLEDRGFHLMDTAMTYVFDVAHDADVPFIGTAAVRECRPEDRAAVLAVAHEAFARYTGRFGRDSTLPAELARRMYIEWVTNACLGKAADRVLVAERGGRIVSFLAYRYVASVLESTGVRVAGQGIVGALPHEGGAFPALLATLTNRKNAVCDLVEFDTSIHNLRSQRLCQRLGFSLGRTKYVFHWSDRRT